jgi:two-component system nitrogen regulation response regulator NtrX
MTPRDTIEVADIPGEAAEGGGGAAGVPAPAAFATLREFKEVAEKAFIISKLEANGWNISKTAKEIDTPRSNLYKKLEQYGLAKEGREGEGEAAEDQD